MIEGKCVRFGQKGVRVRKSNPAAKKSFCARHKCASKSKKATPGFPYGVAVQCQSCRAWSCRTR